MSFSALGLDPKILQAVQEAGYTEPTPIQTQAIPQILAGHDLIGIAQTGTGKTAAFTLPMLTKLAAQPAGSVRGTRVLIMTRPGNSFCRSRKTSALTQNICRSRSPPF